MAETLTFQHFHYENISRCDESFPGCGEWTNADWFMALVGEIGELGNLLKKVRRGDPDVTTRLGDDIVPNAEMRQRIADELADCQTYLDLLAGVLNVNLEKALRRKFNEVSERVGSERKL